MFYFLITVHIIICVSLIFTVLLQSGRGANLGAIFGGGGSNTLFGTQSASMLMKATIFLAIAFVVWSVVVTIFGMRSLSAVKSSSGDDIAPPAAMQASPAADEVSPPGAIPGDVAAPATEGDPVPAATAAPMATPAAGEQPVSPLE